MHFAEQVLGRPIGSLRCVAVPAQTRSRHKRAVSSVYRTIPLVSRLPISAGIGTQETSPYLPAAKECAGVTQITSPPPVSGIESLATFS